MRAAREPSGHRGSDQCRPQHHERKRHVEQEQRGKGRSRDHPRHRGLQGPPRHPQQGLEHDQQHGRLQPEEQRGHGRNVARHHEHHRQAEHHQGAWDDEQQPGDQPALCAVQQPAEICGQLLRLWPGQQRAEVERMQEPPVADPPALVHHFAMQERDLARRPAERQQADLQPDPGRLCQTGKARRADPRVGCDDRAAHRALPPLLGGGQLWLSPVASRHQRYSAS